MRKIKWTLIGIISFFVIAFFHYSLPSRDIVQIVGTEVTRMDVGNGSWLWASKDAGTNNTSTRDVRFINAAWPNGDPYVYRNEDTSWSWPPYLKFDSGDLQSQAQGFAKSEETIWVAVTHYGWRIPLISLYPNAIKMKRVEGPDVTLIPWFNIAFLIVVASIFIWLFIRIRRFKANRVDPVLNNVNDTWEDVETAASDVWDTVEDTASDAGETAKEAGKGFTSLFKRWFGTTK